MDQKQEPPSVPKAQYKYKSFNTQFCSTSATDSDKVEDTDLKNTSRDNTSNRKPTAHCNKSNLQSSSMALCANSARVGPINAHPTHVLMVPNTVTVTRTIPGANCSASTSNSGVSCSSHSNNAFKRMRSMNETNFGSTTDQGEHQQQQKEVQPQQLQEKSPIHGFNVRLSDVSSSIEDACEGSRSGVAQEYSTSAMGHVEQHQVDKEVNHQQIDTSTIQMTVEQIDDVIDKVDLPTNFSFPSPTTKRKPKARKAPILPISPKRARVAAPQCANPSSMDVNESTSMDMDTTTNALMSMTAASAFTPHTTTSASFSTPSKKRKAASSSPRKPSPTNTNLESTSSSSSTNMLNPSLKTTTSGRWTREEHEAFLEGLKIFGREWKKVAQNIPTRTSAQIRSHAQKYFAKLARDEQQQAANASLSLGYAPNAVMSNVASLGIAGEAAIGGEGGLNVGVVGGGGEFTQSVLERVDKILKDPRGAQLEVEETLTKLRARYNELQEKLLKQRRRKEQEEYQRRLRQQEQHQMQKMGGVDGLGKWVNPNEGQSNSRQPSTNMKLAPLAQAQNVVELTDHERPSHASRPDMESLSNVLMSERFSAARNSRSSHLSPITLSTQSLKLHSEELIALHVLGGELYRSASRENLSNMHGNDSDRLPSDEPQGSPGSDATDKKDNRKQQAAHDNENN